MTSVFTENQRFSQWWLWILILGIVGLMLYGLVQQVFFGVEFGNQPMSDSGLILFSFVLVAFAVIFANIRLRTRIDKQAIGMQFTPLLKRTYRWDDVESALIISYGFVGYGIRLGSKHGIIYNVNGNKGLALVLKSGKKLVIGTQKPEELEAFLMAQGLL